MNAKMKKLISFMKKQGVSYPLWNSWLFGIKFELKVLPSKLRPNERVLALIPCRYQGNRALAVITSIRVIVLNQGMFGRFSNNQVDSVYYKQSSGGTSSGSLISRYSISVPGEGNDMDITNLWFKDLDRFDSAYNKARQLYEKHSYDINNKQNREKVEPSREITDFGGQGSHYSLTREEQFIIEKQRLKNRLDEGVITLEEFKILNDDVDRKADEYLQDKNN